MLIGFAILFTFALGTAAGDFLSQSRVDGGLALGTVGTSEIFLITILSIVIFLTITKRDHSQIVERRER